MSPTEMFIDCRRDVDDDQRLWLPVGQVETLRSITRTLLLLGPPEVVLTAVFRHAAP